MSFEIEIVFTDPHSDVVDELATSYVFPGRRETLEQARHDADVCVTELPLHRGPALIVIRDASGAIVDADECPDGEVRPDLCGRPTSPDDEA